MPPPSEDDFIFNRMSVCVCMLLMHVSQGALGGQERALSSGVTFTDGCESPKVGGLELNSGPL